MATREDGGNLLQEQGLAGALATAGFILALVAGVVGAVNAFSLIGQDRFVDDLVVTFIVVLVMAAIAVGGAVLAWKGAVELGGALGIAAGIGFLVAQPEVAGYLAVAGGILMLVANRFEERPQSDRSATQTRTTTARTEEITASERGARAPPQDAP